jgi:hypothetical protein
MLPKVVVKIICNVLKIKILSMLKESFLILNPFSKIVILVDSSMPFRAIQVK